MAVPRIGISFQVEPGFLAQLGFESEIEMELRATMVSPAENASIHALGPGLLEKIIAAIIAKPHGRCG